MQAALHYLLRDPSAARDALDAARAAGDRTRSTGRLEQLVAELGPPAVPSG